MAKDEKKKQESKRKPYRAPAIEAEDDFAEETMLQFASSGLGSFGECSGSGCF